MAELTFATPFAEQKYKATLLLQGAPGTGKTTIAAQFPKCVLFNFDGNLRSLKKLPPNVISSLRIVTPAVNSTTGKALSGEKVWDNFINQLEKVLASDDVQTVVIDSLSSLANVLFDKIVGSSDPSKSLEIQHYGAFDRYLKYLGNDVLTDSTLDKTIIMIAHEQLLDSGKEVLNIPTRQKQSFGLFFTDVWRTFTKASIKGEPEYLIRTQPTMRHELKCSLDLPTEFKFADQRDVIFKQLS